MELTERAKRDDLIRTVDAKLRVSLRRRPTGSEIEREMLRLDERTTRAWIAQQKSAPNRLRTISAVRSKAAVSTAPRSLRRNRVVLWPIGVRQRAEFSLIPAESAANAPGAPPPCLYLHNYSEKPVVEVWVIMGKHWYDYIPGILPGESAEVDWPEGDRKSFEGEGRLDDDGRLQFEVKFIDSGRLRSLPGAMILDDSGRPAAFEGDEDSYLGIGRMRAIR